MNISLSSIARRCAVVSVVTIVAVGLAACSSGAVGASKTGKESTPESAGTILIMNQPAGNPFADLVFSGLQRLQKEKGIPAKQVPGVQAGAYEQQLRSAASNGFNPVMVLWDDLGNAVGKVAPDFPKTKFIIVDSTVDPHLKNVQTLTIDTLKPAYLAGVVGAHLSKTGKLGFVGGQDMGVVNDYGCGFKAGVKAAAPSDSVTTTYAGTFTDPLKGQQIAASLKGDGVDVILQAANQTGLGVLKGAAQNGIIGIGSDSWQGDIAKGSVPWSALKDAGTAAYQVAKNVVDNKFKAGMYVYDAEKGAPLFDKRDLDALTPDLQATVKEIEAELRAGTIHVSC
ncbi:MAG: BMP family ABC transporter substrate-binding protein [Microbacteriaceae bacterium]|nr:MAG: BMP family ABC transporter substrate-binding protein [Microbacteriaceae bacterium]